jgi:hypothetical protein
MVVIHGCREDDTVRPDINRPPETILSVAPEEGDRVFHKYRVRWTGLDRDGVVVTYKVASLAEDELYGGRTNEDDIIEYLLGLDWIYTDATESLFVFRADRPNSRNHSLYVAAIDNEGKEDGTPAVTNFMAIDYGLPEIEILISDNLNPIPRVAPPRGDTLPEYNLQDPAEPIYIKLQWHGIDPDGDILEWRYRLDSSAEVTVPSQVDSVVFTYDPNDRVTSDVWIGFHEFRLVAIDDAQAKSEEKVARFVINYDPDTVIDSVWTFRNATDRGDMDSLETKLVFASAWRDSPEVYADKARTVYQFGQLMLKFHATDLDGPLSGVPPEYFKWNIKGTLLKTDWISNACGLSGDTYYYCDITPPEPFLDSDKPFTLFVSSQDHSQKADGSPDTIMFVVNYPPEIQSISHEIIRADSVVFTWQAYDPDEGYGWGIPTGEFEQALMKYRYRVDGGRWVNVTARDQTQKYYARRAGVGRLEPGTHTFELHVYNGDYLLTRADRQVYEFEL